MLENTEGVMKKDNPEKLATLGTQDTGQKNVRESRRGNEKEQSRETGNIGYTRQIKVREYRSGKKKGQSRETGNIGYTRQINDREYRRGNEK